MLLYFALSIWAQLEYIYPVDVFNESARTFYPLSVLLTNSGIWNYAITASFMAMPGVQ